jgi:DtxR family transcriptional regulator, Mn-dependent transcriptional regulator
MPCGRIYTGRWHGNGVSVDAQHHYSENIENYLEHILRISKKNGHAKTGEIARSLAVAPSSVTEMLSKLEKMGFIRHEAYKGVTLTEEGYFRALAVLKKHNLAQRFLQEVVGMDAERAEEWGCRMEHVMPPELEAWFYQELLKRERAR